MNVLTRNYFRMLRNGAFGENEPMEPMSKYNGKHSTEGQSAKKC